MSGLYWKVADDGAKWRCSECQELFPHEKVIIFQHTEKPEFKLLCLNCVDAEWLANARCLGVK